MPFTWSSATVLGRGGSETRPYKTNHIASVNTSPDLAAWGQVIDGLIYSVATAAGGAFLPRQRYDFRRVERRAVEVYVQPDSIKLLGESSIRDVYHNLIGRSVCGFDHELSRSGGGRCGHPPRTRATIERSPWYFLRGTARGNTSREELGLAEKYEEAVVDLPYAILRDRVLAKVHGDARSSSQAVDPDLSYRIATRLEAAQFRGRDRSVEIHHERRWLRRLVHGRPGHVTLGADDNPLHIGTYSDVGDYTGLRGGANQRTCCK